MECVYVTVIGEVTREKKGDKEIVKYTKYFDAKKIFRDVPYPEVRKMIENGDLKVGMQVNVLDGDCYLSDLDEFINFTVLNITVSMESPKDPEISDSDNEDKNSDNEDEKIDWANELTILYKYNPDYDKTQTVCGCGC